MVSSVLRPAFRFRSLNLLKTDVGCGLKTLNSHRKCVDSSIFARVLENRLWRTYTVRHVTAAGSIVTPVFLRAENFLKKNALVNQFGHYTYDDVLHYSASLATEFNTTAKIKESQTDFDKDSRFPLAGERIAFLCENDMSYVVTQWAIWMCGAIAVPLCKSHPTSELRYFAEDSGAKLLVCVEKHRSKLEPVSSELGVSLHVLTVDSYSGDYEDDVSHWATDAGRKLRHTLEQRVTTDTYRDTKAQIVYTSGTTGRPKGVVHTFGNIDVMIQGMISAWGWTENDVILHVLPLHHVHGIVNVLMTPLYCGATCVMQPSFHPDAVWKALLSYDPSINVFMAVPTIYAKLLEEYERQKHSDNPYIPANVKEILTQNVRLMVSGSAALPEPIMKKWEELTGHTLLERYGMTETGMVLTNPLIGRRVPGSVGLPFPGVTVSIVDHDQKGSGFSGFRILAQGDSNGIQATPGHENESGELLVKGGNVFKEYWNKPKATKETFTKDGWFKTGDTAMLSDGAVKIIGRTSVDVIKSGSYKISALDIERHLLEHQAIKDVAVIGLPDETWGQLIIAVVVLKPGQKLSLSDLKEWSKEKMATYQVPKQLKIMEEMPRNAMGKVNKKELAKVLFPDYLK